MSQASSGIVVLSMRGATSNRVYMMLQIGVIIVSMYMYLSSILCHLCICIYQVYLEVKQRVSNDIISVSFRAGSAILQQLRQPSSFLLQKCFGIDGLGIVRTGHVINDTLELNPALIYQYPSMQLGNLYHKEAYGLLDKDSSPSSI